MKPPTVRRWVGDEKEYEENWGMKATTLVAGKELGAEMSNFH